ncbi:MAG: family 20 glycosylhydrolase [Phycisphaerae bacterium]|jgi:hexosaminidase|nr:family 20 glycosylhydrolase [Phycisphaerae bacterium]
MRRIAAPVVFVLLVLAAVAPAGEISVIPQPTSMTRGEGEFVLTSSTRIVVAGVASEGVANVMAGYLSSATGYKLAVSRGDAADGAIWVDAACTDKSVAKLGKEGYSLSVTPKRITIRASTGAGAFYGVQTLRQLLPPGVFSSKKVDGIRWSVPCVTISDSPRFGWRGMMLDSSRHFQNVDTIKRFIDNLATHKLNVFHWHLVDSHGWRVEIKKYPRLTSVGGFRRQPPIGRYGGFYTQAEIREIVKYASERFVTIVPEIEMPGHSKAATASYPYLACGGDGKEVAWFYGYPCPGKSFPKIPGSDVFCAGKDTTFEFLQDVLTEVFELFPSKFIHVGGDEVRKGHWKACEDCQKRVKTQGLKKNGLQSYFMKRMEKFINARGRRMIGWDEILHGGLAPNATVMSWRGVKGGVAAAKMGHDAVMSPQKPLYFDHGQATGGGGHPKHWPGRETLEEVYKYDPIPAELTADQAKHILGCQANVWSAFIHSDEVLDCMAWPRGAALAETAWQARNVKDYAKFLPRLAIHKERLDLLEISYWDEPKPVQAATKLGWMPADTPREYAAKTWKLPGPLTPGQTYRVTFKWTRGKHGLNVKNVFLRSGETKLTDSHEGFAGGRSRDNSWGFTLPQSAPKTGWTLTADIQGSAGTNSTGTITVDTGKVSWRRRRIVPDIATTIPVTQNRDRRIYDWATRCKRIIERNKSVNPDIIFLGDSITHYWSGEPKAPIVSGQAAWDKLFAGYAVTNMGFGWDRTENVVHRLRNGALDGISPQLAVILIGTNNLAVKNTPREIYWGVQAIVDEIHKRCGDTKILLLGVLPRKRKFAHTPERVNNLLATLNDRPYVRFYNVNYHLLDKDGRVRKDLYRDGVHPGAKGYAAIAAALRPVIDELLIKDKKGGSVQRAVSSAKTNGKKDPKKRVLILGDSTSMRYSPILKKIYPEVDIVRPGGNHQGTVTALKHIDKWLGKDKWDVIHFNFGLHDFKHVDPKTGKSSNNPEHPFWAPPEQYRKNLEAIVKRLKKTGAILIFATTTPVPKDEHYRVIDNRMSPVYNKIALEIMKKNNVLINDLYNYTLPNLDKWQQKKDVHFHKLGSTRIAEKIKESIKSALSVR